MALTVRQLDGFECPGLRAAWARLSALSRRASLFTTYEWCRCWSETLGRGAEVAVHIVENRDGETVGLLPTCIERGGPARWLKMMGRDGASGDHLDLLAADADYEPCLSALLERWERPAGFDGLVLSELHADSPMLTRVRHWARQRGLAVAEREPRVVPYVCLPAAFDDYLAALSGNMRYHVRRRRRGFDKLVGARSVVVHAADQVDEALSELFCLHELRWQRDGQAGNFRNPLKRQFLRRFCLAAAEKGWLRMHVLELAGQREAMLLAFHWNKTASFYQMGWNPETPIKSPGVVLLADSMATAIAEGMSCYDFLRGDEEYKRKWTTQHVAQITLVVGCRSAARAVMLGQAVKSGVKRATRKTLGNEKWERMKRLVKSLTHNPPPSQGGAGGG